ncbi:hypothetical protein QIH80_24925 [Bradyrhizobium elkanii]|nr:hypothetical protein QIH80_24925 [Bradyrhizobium elkanii]
MTPFSSANGIFIDWIFSSGVMGTPCFVAFFEVDIGMMDCLSGPGNDV